MYGWACLLTACIVVGKKIINDINFLKYNNKADFNSCLDVAGWITPVPGGVGQVTTAHLMQNVVSAAKQQKKLYLATYSNAKNNNNAAA